MRPSPSVFSASAVNLLAGAAEERPVSESPERQVAARRREPLRVLDFQSRRAARLSRRTRSQRSADSMRRAHRHTGCSSSVSANHASGDSARTTCSASSIVTRSAPSCVSSDAIHSGSPQRFTDPSGFGKASHSTSATALMPPTGHQDVSATTPPDRVTRIISPAACAASAAKITPNTLITASNSPATGSRSASPATNSTSRLSSRARRRASDSSPAAGSTPVTAAPARAAASAALPVPHPTSSTRCPAAIPSCCTTAIAIGSSRVAVWP